MTEKFQEREFITEKEARQDAREIASVISEYDENLASINKAARNGISKEHWLADKISPPPLLWQLMSLGRYYNPWMICFIVEIWK